MGFSSKEDKLNRIWRALKTLFFLITLLISFLLFSLPILFVLADALLPSALLSVSLPNFPLSLGAISSHFTNYDFRYSLIDIPLISIIRSCIIICVYCFCDGPRLSRGPYLGVTTICSVLSLLVVTLKAPFVFTACNGLTSQGDCSRATEFSLFTCSWVLAIGHILVAYRTSCRERRKLLVYKIQKIDIESISAAKHVLPRYQKILQQERM